MELQAGYPYFLLKNGLLADYGQLKKNIATDVLIIGGGISGALMAYRLAEAGIECTVVDRRCIGLGSTCASTALLLYEIDTPLHQLIPRIGKRAAQLAFRLCAHSIDIISQIAGRVGQVKFDSSKSLYFAHDRSRINFIKREFAARKEAGFKVRLLQKDELKSVYGLNSPIAILSEKAAKIDAYRFTHALHSYSMKHGAAVYDNTCIEEIRYEKRNVVARTKHNFFIKAKKIVYASGYEMTSTLKGNYAKLRSTYAFVSKRLENLPRYLKETVFWNTAQPYLYAREDAGRLLVGGRDEPYLKPEKRDKLMRSKAKLLAADFENCFQDIRPEVQFSWCGTFASTKDGLPYIGMHPHFPRSYFSLGYGGNGITFSALAAEIITSLIKYKKHSCEQLLSFNR